MFIIEYFEEHGKSPVVDYLAGCAPREKAKILRGIDLLEEFGLALGMPYLRKIENTDDLWELRIQVGKNRYRLMYFTYTSKTFVLLHGFQKHSEKTPPREIKIALERRKRYLDSQGGINHEP